MIYLNLLKQENPGRKAEVCESDRDNEEQEKNIRESRLLGVEEV